MPPIERGLVAVEISDREGLATSSLAGIQCPAEFLVGKVGDSAIAGDDE